jgi:hypothetical protein
LHPICPHCGYDNTSVQKAGKDLSANGATHELVNVSEIIKTKPWQPVITKPFDNGDGCWYLETPYMTIKWPYKVLPCDIASVYLLKAPNGRMMIKGWYDESGKVHQI